MKNSTVTFQSVCGCCVLSAAILLAGAATADDVTLNVASGTTKAFAAALSENGYDSFASGSRIVKTGAGMLTASSDSAIKSAVGGIWVKEGAFNVTSYEQFGPDSFRGVEGLYRVDDGATLYFTGSGCVMIGQVVHIKGRGSSALGPAAVPKNGAIAIANNVYAFGVTYKLADDATMMNVYGARHAQMFGKWTAAAWRNPTCIDLGNGNALTMSHTDTAKTAGMGFLLTTDLKIAGSGRIIMDSAPLVQKEATFNAIRDAGTSVELVLTNSAQFHITAPAVAGLFDNIEVNAGSVVKGVAAADIALDVSGISGTGAVGGGISILGISGTLGVSAERMAAGAMLSATGEVAFAAGSKVAFDGDLSALEALGNAEYPVLFAHGGISGMPAVEGVAKRHFRVRKSADGKTLNIVYVAPKPSGAVDVVADWGVVEGSFADGAANAALLSSRLAAAPAGTVAYFPPGDYYFGGGLSVSGANGIVLAGDGDASVLHGSGASNVITVVDSSAVTVTHLVLEDCTGPAVAASGADALAVSNVFYSSVGGVVAGDGGLYPVAIASSAGTYVRHNRVTDGALYAAPVWRDGGSAAEGSEPLEGLVDVWVDEGDEEGFSEAFTKTGYAAFPAATRLAKSGPGTLTATNNLTSVMRGATIMEGIMRFSVDKDIGVSGYGIVVSNGATAVFMHGMYVANRPIYISGTGARGMGGAIVAEGQIGAGNMSLRLTDGDSVIVGRYRGNLCALLSGGGSETSSSVYLGGNTLTLRAENGCTGIATNYKLVQKESGKIAVDGTVLTDITSDTSTKYAFSADPGVRVTVSLVNGAGLKPKFESWMSMFSGIEGEAGTLIDCMLASKALPLVLADFAGLPTLGANIASLSVTNLFVADAADVMAGRCFSADCPIAFGASAKVALKDPSRAFASASGVFRYPFVRSSVSLSGSPARSRAESDMGGWGLSRPDGALSFDIVPPQGFVVLVE